MALDRPSGVIRLAEREQCPSKLFDGLEHPHPQKIHLEITDETLGAAVSLRCVHEGRRAFDAEEADLVLKRRRRCMRSVIMPDGETESDAPGDVSEMLAHPLADRFERLEPGGALRGMDAGAFGRAMADRNEHGRLALAGDRRGQGSGANELAARPGDARARRSRVYCAASTAFQLAEALLFLRRSRLRLNCPLRSGAAARCRRL
jgi:hypothetical protein